MQRYLLVFTLLFSFHGFSQDEAYKNDFSIGYGFELNHFRNTIGSLTYRRDLNEKWMAKITIMGKRNYADYDALSSIAFDLSDSAIMRRNQYSYMSLGRTLKLGVDYVKLKNFSFGTQFIIGKAIGQSYFTDRAFYSQNSDSDDVNYIYSEELTDAYHPRPLQQAAGSIQVGGRTKQVGSVSYLALGLGLTTEAKWPIGEYFEAALQYSPELLYFKANELSVVYDQDVYIETEIPNLIKMRQFLNLAFRCKF